MRLKFETQMIRDKNIQMTADNGQGKELKAVFSRYSLLATRYLHRGSYA